MAKRRFDFDDVPADKPVPPAAAPAAAAQATGAAKAAGPAARQPGLKRKPQLPAGPQVAAVIESRDHGKLATLYLDGRIQNTDSVTVMQFRENGDIEDHSQRVLGRFFEGEIRDHANRTLAAYADGILRLPTGEPQGYFTEGRIENDARNVVGYYTVTQAPAGRPVEALVAAYLLWLQPTCWQDDEK